MGNRVDKTVPDHRLTVAEVLGMLMADGMVEKPDADALVAESRLKRLAAHPLVVVANQKWKSARAPNNTLTIDFLGEWFAAKVGLDYYHIDPLKIDFTAVTEGEQEVALSYWPDEASIRAWKQHTDHLMAQKLGRERWYASYVVEVAEVKRQYRHP